METKAFKTRTIIESKRHPMRKDDFWPLAIDMGYSAVKVLSGNGYACFPAYAKKLPKNTISLAKPLQEDILYRDPQTGDIYAVGQKAEMMISAESAGDNNNSLYGRNRYFSEIFKVTSRVGLALGMRANEFYDPTGKRIKIQTGLPPAYLLEDTKYLREALSGDFSFDIKIGKGNWEHYSFRIDPTDVFVTQQPMGTMVSVAIDKNGRPTPDCETLYHSNMLIFDPGFRTGDSCLIRGGDINPDDCHTFEDLSMIEILQQTCDIIKAKYDTNITVPAIQPYLETGTIKMTDRATLSSKKVEFGDILNERSILVCENAINKLLEVYNYFQEIDYLVLTGGTGAAWSTHIRNKFKNLEALTILSGNRNEDLPHIFSNVRGYYMYLINQA